MAAVIFIGTLVTISLERRKTLVELPNWVTVTWMIVWAFLGYIFAPYGMWKHHRTQIASSSQLDQK
jgi:CHASE2 domain-containing sensor protein